MFARRTGMINPVCEKNPFNWIRASRNTKQSVKHWLQQGEFEIVVPVQNFRWVRCMVESVGVDECDVTIWCNGQVAWHVHQSRNLGWCSVVAKKAVLHCFACTWCRSSIAGMLARNSGTVVDLPNSTCSFRVSPQTIQGWRQNLTTEASVSRLRPWTPANAKFLALKPFWPRGFISGNYTYIISWLCQNLSNLVSNCSIYSPLY